MDINIAGLTTGILVAVFSFVVTLPRLLYFLFRGKALLGSKMFKGRNLTFFILSFLSSIAYVVLAVIFSQDFHMLGLFFVYMILATIGVSLYFIVWIMFWMHGNEARYQFELIEKIPAPMTILSGFVLLLGAGLTLNYYNLACVSLFLVSALLFDLAGYKLTRPINPDDD